MFFYVTVHHFLVRVQSPTCTTYGKVLLESIMAVLTPKSGITEKNNEELGCEIIKNSISMFGHFSKQIFFVFNTC